MPHAIPDGELFTVPDPLPVRLTDSVGVEAGGAGSDPVAEPLTARETVSPWAVKFTFEAKLPRARGRNRTTTDVLAPAARVKDAPDTMLNGEPTLAPPDTLAPLVFWTVNVRSRSAPRRRLPKFTAPVGDTLRAPLATPLAVGEHALWLPLRSTAEIRTQYVAPGLRFVSVALTVWFASGEVVDEAMAWYEEPGQVGVEVPI